MCAPWGRKCERQRMCVFCFCTWVCTVPPHKSMHIRLYTNCRSSWSTMTTVLFSALCFLALFLYVVYFSNLWHHLFLRLHLSCFSISSVDSQESERERQIEKNMEEDVISSILVFDHLYHPKSIRFPHPLFPSCPSFLSFVHLTCQAAVCMCV